MSLITVSIEFDTGVADVAQAAAGVFHKELAHQFAEAIGRAGGEEGVVHGAAGLAQGLHEAQGVGPERLVFDEDEGVERGIELREEAAGLEELTKCLERCLELGSTDRRHAPTLGHLGVRVNLANR